MLFVILRRAYEFVIWKTLHLRKQLEALFRLGAYQPLAAEGTKSAHLCVFARIHQEMTAVVIVPRLTYGLLAGNPVWPLDETVWEDTRVRLPGTTTIWRNVLTGERLSFSPEEGQTLMMHRALKSFPLALLTPDTVTDQD